MDGEKSPQFAVMGQCGKVEPRSGRSISLNPGHTGWNPLTKLHSSGCEALCIQEWSLWARQPGTITSPAAKPCLVSGVNTVSDSMSSGCLLGPVDQCGCAGEGGQRSSLSPRCWSGTSAQTCQRLIQVHPGWRHGAGRGSQGALDLQSFSPSRENVV